MKYDYHVIVIGAGGAGLSVASGCAMFGAKTALIEKDRMGGECTNFGCVPSKALINGAHIAKAINSAGGYGISARIEKIDLKKMMEHGKTAVDFIAARESVERFTAMGIDVISGEAAFEDAHTIKIGSRSISGKYIVIATGSKPLVPPIPGLHGVPYLTNETIFDLNKLPEHFIILGGGPVGLEFGQSFNYLGSNVTVIDMLTNLFPKDDFEVGPVMEKLLQTEGINLFLSSKILEIKENGGLISVMIEKDGSKRQINGDALLVALGRTPGTMGLEIEKARVELDSRGYVKVGPDMRTNIRHIFACGDITGQYQFSHMAGYQGGIVVRNIILPVSAKADYSNVPWVTFTKPEVAHTGITEQEAKVSGIFNKSILVGMELSDRAVLEFKREGFLKLVLGRGNRLLGATIVGDKASEMIGLAALAIKRRMKGTEFYQMIITYPTDTDLYHTASKGLLKDSLKPWMKRIVKILFIR